METTHAVIHVDPRTYREILIELINATVSVNIEYLKDSDLSKTAYPVFKH